VAYTMTDEFKHFVVELDSKPLPTLDEIAHRESDPKLWTDKRTIDGHGYTLIYEAYFELLRDKPINLLEIGVNQGASIIMWLEYFQKAKIYGIDINPSERPKDPRYEFTQGDQQSVEFWTEYTRGHPQFDIVIDDGGHSSGQIETSYRCLLPHLKPGGLYCIEDMGEAYSPDRQTPGYGNHLEFMKLCMDWINRGRGDIMCLNFYKELAIFRRNP
jgi:demethylmacrocin O-methyltransferase